MRANALLAFTCGNSSPMIMPVRPIVRPTSHPNPLKHTWNPDAPRYSALTASCTSLAAVDMRSLCASSNASLPGSASSDPAEANMAMVVRSPTLPSMPCVAASQPRMPLTPRLIAVHVLAVSADSCCVAAERARRVSKSSAFACARGGGWLALAPTTRWREDVCSLR